MDVGLLGGRWGTLVVNMPLYTRAGLNSKLQENRSKETSSARPQGTQEDNDPSIDTAGIHEAGINLCPNGKEHVQLGPP